MRNDHSRQYRKLHTAVFSPDYPGYTPGVVESPDGNTNYDDGKRYAHIALKYLDNYRGDYRHFMLEVLYAGIAHAKDVAIELGIAPAYWPHEEDSTIRILEYPPGEGSLGHTDFDLFTLPMYRNITSGLFSIGDAALTSEAAQVQFPGMQVGELMEEVNSHWCATRHGVTGNYRWQFSAVFFAMPKLDAVLPSGYTVQEWLTERKDRSRKAA